MPEQRIAEDNIVLRIRLLMIFRAAIVTFILGVAYFMDVKGAGYASEISIPSLYKVIYFSYFLSFIYLIFIKTIQNYRINIYIQTFCDIAMITGLVYVTGGLRSIYTVFYPLVIIYSVLFLGKTGGILSASASSIFYGLLIDLEYYGVITPLDKTLFQDSTFTSSYVFLRIIIHILSFYIIAALASFVVEREKQARSLLAERESAFNRLDRLYRSIVESINAGILTIDLEGRIKSFNRGAEDITGYFFYEVENRNIHTLFPLWKKILNVPNDENAVETRNGRVEIPYIDKNNRKLILGCSVSTLKEESGNKIGDIVIFQDMTQIRQMEEAVEKNRRLAFVGEMAASLAHELRNPLASISGSIQMLKRDLALRKSDERLMQIIIRGKDQLECFIKDFLLLARHKHRDEEEVNLGAVISEVIDSLKVDDEWNDSIVVEKNIIDPIILFTNKAEIRQVISNLVLNAIQAMPDGGKLTLEARTIDTLAAEVVELKISDNGEGIDTEDLQRIFEPFYTTKEKGTGLGLAIVNRIVEASMGEIYVASVPNCGTTFTVRFPTGLKE
ncbi:MAG: Adaptive-response sensory-kinase SasA [Syntrophus sp. SKADARSKE-3]|nr:Adaptive-response sensory-kinase SasA [Syntrophus sp. SKADARSKE-3]